MTASLHELHDFARNRSGPAGGATTAHFGELHGPLLRFIADSEVLVGCVAWVTSGKILDALARADVCLVVQKESWWKKKDARGSSLARRYAALTTTLTADLFPAPLGVKVFRGKLVADPSSLAPVSCVGYGATTKASPLMHHKFVVRCRRLGDGTLEPLAVWTGSFNFSANANDSFENAVEIHDPDVAAAYLAEFALIASLSEPMNWRLARPNPKGAGNVAAFTPLPAVPAVTTTNVVKKGAGKKRAAAKKRATSRPARGSGAKKPTTARAAKKSAASRPAAKPKKAPAKTQKKGS